MAVVEWNHMSLPLSLFLSSGRDLQGRFPSRARSEREAEPEEGGAAGSADSGPG